MHSRFSLVRLQPNQVLLETPGRKTRVIAIKKVCFFLSELSEEHFRFLQERLRLCSSLSFVKNSSNFEFNWCSEFSSFYGNFWFILARSPLPVIHFVFA